VAVSEAIDRDTADEIEVFLSVRAPDLHPPSFSKDNGESVIRIHEVAGRILQKFLDLHAGIITQKSLKNQTDRL
jgi:hypothetical protein